MFRSMMLRAIGLLLVLCCFNHMIAAEELKSVILRSIDFQRVQDAHLGPSLQVVARVRATGMPGLSAIVDTTVTRADGAPLSVSGNLPPGWRRTEQGLKYSWKGTNPDREENWILKTILPESLFSGTGNGRYMLKFRSEVKSGGLESRMDAEVGIPFTSMDNGRRIVFNEITRTETVQTLNQPNPAGMEVETANHTIRNRIALFKFQFLANGFTNETAYVGVVFRDRAGKPVGPSALCPRSNLGQNGQAQFQAADQVKFEKAGWKGFPLKVPLQWLALDPGKEQRLIATCYVSAGGLWSVHDREVMIGGTGDDGGIEFTDTAAGAGTNATALFAAVDAGDRRAVARLLADGADVRSRNDAGEVPLHVAVRKGHAAVARMLLEADQRQARRENQENATMSFDQFLDDSFPTLHMADKNQITPAQAAADDPAMARLVSEFGTDPAAPTAAGRDAPASPESRMGNASVTRYTGDLREILAELQRILRSFEQLKASGSNRLQAVQTQGKRLYAVGDRFTAFLEAGDTAVTRFGTLEELDLISQIRKTHEQAALIFKSLCGVRLPEPERNGTRERTLLDEAARSMIEQEVVGYIQRQGLEDMLADDPRQVLGKSVGKELALDLKGFMDRKAREVTGMPMGGFKSMQAAFRLQARRKISETVARLTMDFTGNRLVIFLLQRTVLKWVEGELWPFLREAFRPKTKLPRRVDISANTMLAMRDQLNALGSGGDASMFPLKQVVDTVERAHGTIHAARYLKKDLDRAGKQDLKNRLAEAERQLERTIKLVSHRFLLANEKRLREIGDHLLYTDGINEEVGRLLGLMKIPSCTLKLWRPDPDHLSRGDYYESGIFSLPLFDVNIIGIAEGMPAGIKRLTVHINDRSFVLLGRYVAGQNGVKFKGVLPLFPGRNAVHFSSDDIPGIPESRTAFPFKPRDLEKKREQIRSRYQAFPEREQDLRQSSDYHRESNALYLIKDLLHAARLMCEIGDFRNPPPLIDRAENLIRQHVGPRKSLGVLRQVYELRAWLALADNDRSRFLQFKKMEYQEWMRFAANEERTSKLGALDLSWLIDFNFQVADMLLASGFDPDAAKPFVETGVKYLRMRVDEQRYYDSWIEKYPNMAVIFFQK